MNKRATAGDAFLKKQEAAAAKATGGWAKGKLPLDVAVEAKAAPEVLVALVAERLMARRRA